MLIRNFSLTYHPGPFLMSKKDYIEERRTARRFELAWTVVIKGESQTSERFDETCTLQNLSSRGAFFLLPNSVRLGAGLEVEIRVPLRVPMKEKSWMKYSAKVVRVGRQKSKFGVAVTFPTARPIFIKR